MPVRVVQVDRVRDAVVLEIEADAPTSQLGLRRLEPSPVGPEGEVVLLPRS